jgi:hypothetical protein
MSSFAMVLKIDHFRSQVMILERRMQDAGVELFDHVCGYINLN